MRDTIYRQIVVGLFQVSLFAAFTSSIRTQGYWSQGRAGSGQLTRYVSQDTGKCPEEALSVLTSQKRNSVELIAGVIDVADRQGSNVNSNIFVSARNGVDIDVSGPIHCVVFGGDSTDVPLSVSYDWEDTVFITGITRSREFPVTSGSLHKKTDELGDIFVIRVNLKNESIEYSALAGGSGRDAGFGIAVNQIGEAIVIGSTTSSDFPVTNASGPNRHSGKADGFIIKLSAKGDRIIYSSYLGGSEYDDLFMLDLDSLGDAVVSGVTNSPKLNEISGSRLLKHDQKTGEFSVFIPLASICDIESQPIRTQFDSIGGSDNVRVAAEPQCKWNLESDVDWITVIDSQIKQGSGSLPFIVEPNPGERRSGNLMFGGRSFKIVQSGRAQ